MSVILEGEERERKISLMKRAARLRPYKSEAVLLCEILGNILMEKGVITFAEWLDASEKCLAEAEREARLFPSG